ncbi:MAG: hypothetical protein ABI779_14690 [Acidobacteriota bacterium]
MNFTRRMITLALVVLALPLVVSAQQRSVAPNSHSWGSYHWARTANPFTVKLGDNVGSAWDAYLTTASSDWTQSVVLNTTIVAGQSNNNCRMTLGRVEVCARTYGNNGWLGLASINISGNHITQGSVKMNDTYFNTSTYNNPNERLHVMCQEVGHTFGLDHQSTDGSSQNTCMDYFSNTGANAGSTLSTHPNAHDYSQLSTIYSHLDSTNTAFIVAGGIAADSIPAMGEIAFDGPGQWGVEVERSQDGRFSTFVLDFGADRRVITFVTWADDATDEDGQPRVQGPRVRTQEP